MTTIRQLFANQIDRRIEEVIKVDQANAEIIRGEIGEYVVTDAIRRHQREILEVYWDTPRKPHEGTAVWVSGFFGSGKSSFAKMLGLALENRDVCGEGAALLLGKQANDVHVQVLLQQIAEQVRTESVIFDVSTDRGIRSGDQKLTEIMYRLFLEHLGYAKDLDLAELEVTLESVGQLDGFKAKYLERHGKEWDRDKGLVVLAIGRASATMHAIEPATYPNEDSWKVGIRGRMDITPKALAERCIDLMKRRKEGRSLVFVIDEVGQFVARDVQKMLDLQGLVQSFGAVGRGKLWIVVTSQEKLNELVGGLDQSRVELARLMDRFPLQVHLEPSDISEVTSKRVLSKNAGAQTTLRDLFATHRARLTRSTLLSAPGIRLPELTNDSFVDLYPLLPYQVDLIIRVVSGLRLQGGASKHVGGANRTIIKLAQQLLIHQDVDLASKPVGALARIDQIYDLVSGNIASEVRAKIDQIGRQVDHPLAQAVAKAICLLQYEQSIPRTPENLAAALHPSVEADSRLSEVKQALDALVLAHQVRLGDGGYRIPTPAEDDWERQRAELRPKPADSARLLTEVIDGLWQPQPSHTLLDVKPFKAGLFFNNKLVQEGDVPVYVAVAQTDNELRERQAEWRTRSQTERKALFWVSRLDDAVSRTLDEVFRSNEILARKERNAQSKDETALVSEEKRRLRGNLDELKRLTREALLSGTIYFRGNQRGPESGVGDIGKACSRALGLALPEVFDRFQEAASRVTANDLSALLTTENLRGLTPVFTQLVLVREEKGKPVFRTDSGPLAEVLARIVNKASYGELASGRSLTDDLAKEPFGWDFDVVRLLAAALVRAGKVELVSEGQVLDNALALDAKNTLTKNNLFRQATFRPKKGIDFQEVVKAYEAFKAVFGKEVAELEQGAVARAIRDATARAEEDVREIHTLLTTHTLPGTHVLQAAIEQARVIRGGGEDNAVLTFNTCFEQLKEAIRRTAELKGKLTTPGIEDLKRARLAVRDFWPFLQAEADVEPGLADRATVLVDLLERETFFREIPAIDQNAREIAGEYQRRFEAAVVVRRTAYQAALEVLRAIPGWETLTSEQAGRVETPLAGPAGSAPGAQTPIPQIRAETEACSARLAKAIDDLMRLVDGNRIVHVRVSGYFAGGIDTVEQLDAALAGLREVCEKEIGSGKKVVIQ